ncbi:MAG TPA: tyrosine-type recombinase/integrase [Tepidisphaeraceae bacterium]
MASIGSDLGGRKRILFVAPDGKRKTIRLGKVSTKQADALKFKVEDLIAAANGAGTMHDETVRWVAALDDRTHEKLAAVGLVVSRTTASLATMTVGELVTKLSATWAPLKPNTRRNYTQAADRLKEHFTEAKPVRAITEMDADLFRVWMEGEGLAQATIAKYIINVRSMFKKAKKWRVITGDNPFADVRAGSQKNKARQYFISRADAQKVLDACPDAEWRLLFALSRYGGLRCPSEHLLLKRSDVDFEHGRMLVHSPKTEHHEGGESRLVPLFPELEPYLLAVLDQAEEGTNYLITRYRTDERHRQNLRTQLNRIIRRAGLKPWPKTWHNLRSTRQTELSEDFPQHVVCAWMGNSEKVAEGHYLQVTDDHFAKAIATKGKSAAHNAAQSAAGSTGNERESQNPQTKKPLQLQGHSDESRCVPAERRSRQGSNL